MEATVVNGAAKSLLNFCDALKEGGGGPCVDVSIATFHRGPIQEGVPPNEFVAAVQSRGITAIVIPERRAFDARVLQILSAIGKEIKPDLVQTNNVKSHLLVRLAGLNRGRPWIAFHHGYTATDFKVKLYNQVDRWSLRAADRVVTVCGPFRNQLMSAGIPSAKIRILHNSAAVLSVGAPEAVDKIRQTFGLDKDTKVLTAIGRLSYEKGHADLIQALDRMRRSRPDWRWKLLVVGSGPEQARLEASGQQLGLADRIVFAGHQSNVLPFLQLSDLMILPSHSEGSPHVVLEAMAAGVPIVATRVGGVPEILADEKTAVLVPPRDPAALASGIARVLASEHLATSLATNAREVLRERFSHDAYKAALLGIYDEVLRR